MNNESDPNKKSILRHLPWWFKVWLGLFVVIVLAMTVIGLTTHTPKKPPFPLVALLVGLVGASLATGLVVLLRRVRRWFTLRRVVLGVACLATLVALFYSVENWRGKRAWEGYKAELRARGVQLDYAAYLPTPVPDEENFYKTPLLQAVGYKTNNTLTTPGYTNNPAEMERVQKWAGQADAFFNDNVIGDFAQGRPTSFTNVQVNLQKRPIRKAKGEKEPLTTFHSPQEIQALFKDGQNDMDELRAAARRPYSRVERGIGAANPFDTSIPNFVMMRQLGRCFPLQSLLDLETGDSAAALENLRVAQKLADSTQSSPVLLSAMIRCAILGVHLQPIWEGWARNQWSDEQLLALQTYLEQINMLADFDHAMRGECVRVCHWIEQQPLREVSKGLFDSRDAGGAFILPTVPRGWIHHNLLVYARLNFDLNLTGHDVGARTICPAVVEKNNQQLENTFKKKFIGFRSPGHILAAIAIPAAKRAIQTIARNQSYVNLASVAFALERHRRANGGYPESLDKLAPQFMAKVPVDVINGQPLHYRLTENGKFLLYSIGWDEKDNGGTPYPASYKPEDTGDWVWMFPAQ